MECSNCDYALNGTEKECPTCGTPVKQSLSGEISAKVDKAIGPEGFAPIDAKITKISNKIKLVFLSIVLVIEIGLSTYGLMHGLPFYIPVIFLAFTIGLILLTTRANRKISQVDFKNPEQNYSKESRQSIYKGQVSAKPGTNVFGENKIKLDPGEALQTFLTPVYRSQGNFSGPSMVSVERFTENVIAITDRRLLFFTVPMAGQGMLINGASEDLLNSEMKRNTIKGSVSEKIEELKAGNPVDHFPNDFWIDRASLEKVAYLKGAGPVKFMYAGAIGFWPQGGKKLKYMVVGNENFDDAVSLLNAQKKLAI